MDYPKFSIITVVYNRVSSLERTIKSVLSQSYKNIEYIIIDGASTDGTVAIIEKYSDKISKWLSERDEGIYDAMNKGIKIATGDVIAFLNSDDWYLEDCLTYVAKQFAENDIDACFLGVTRTDNEGKRNDRYSKIRKVDEGYERMDVFHPATFVKKSIFDMIGLFDTEYRIAADYDWLLHMKKQGFVIRCVDYVTTYYSEGGISNTNWFKAQDEAENSELKYAQDEAEKSYIRQLYAENWGRKKYLECLAKEDMNDFAMKELLFYIGKKIYIFGAGNMGRECCQLLYRNGLKVEGFIDNNKDRCGTLLEGYLINLPQILDKENDTIIIAVISYADEIEDQLFQLGIQKDKITRYISLKETIVSRLAKERLEQGHEI